VLQSTDVSNNERIQKKEAIPGSVSSMVPVAEISTGGENLQCSALEPNVCIKPNPAPPVPCNFKYMHI